MSTANSERAVPEASEQPELLGREMELCAKCGLRPRFWSATDCEPCLWALVEADANPAPLDLPF